MKTITKFFLLLAVTLAVGSSARAQVQYAPSGVPYVFTSTAFSGTDAMSYQWFRNGRPIAGATSLTYTLPGDKAFGANQEFKCGSVITSCQNMSHTYSNPITITFGAEPPPPPPPPLVKPEPEPIVVGSIRWAATNVDSYQTFAERPDMYTKFYQWGRSTAWAATGGISGWSGGDYAITATTWAVNPCPAGWRLPSGGEYQALHNSGSTWRAANARGNAVAGRFYGANHAGCSLAAGGSMEGCIFLPAVGNRLHTNGTLENSGTLGHYWSTTNFSTTNGFILRFHSSSSIPADNYNKASGFSVRCVQ